MRIELTKSNAVSDWLIMEQIRGSHSDNLDNLNDVEVTFTKPNTKSIDSVLDEIDAVLEKNAEEFVKGFIQKGGQ